MPGSAEYTSPCISGLEGVVRPAEIRRNLDRDFRAQQGWRPEMLAVGFRRREV